MASLGARTRTRQARTRLCFALASLLLSVSCVETDPVETTDCECEESPFLGARLSNGPAPHFYVSPTGSPSGDGSFTDPWDLATALAGPDAVTPGSTIWLRGGTYANGTHFDLGYVSDLTGSADAPIVVRQFPGERATVTNFLIVRGAHTWYWGFEVMHPAPHAGAVFGIDVRGPLSKLINLVVHDASASGILIHPTATDAEVYGTISYNNGRSDNFDHGIYCQSQSHNLLKDNIVFQNWAFGIHCFSETGLFLQNIHLEGNVTFNNYVWGVPRADLFVGGEFPASGITIDQNYTYRTDSTEFQVADIGWDFTVNEDVAVTDNYFVGAWIHVGAWTTATVTGNTLYHAPSGGMVDLRGDLSGHTWSDNIFFGDSSAVAWRYNGGSATTFNEWQTLTSLTDAGAYAGPAPTETKVVVRPNQYEPGRAHIIVYNWAQQSAVSVDVSGILHPGDHYVVQHAQDFYGEPVASGVYTGGPLDLPMVRITPPTPLGATTEPAPVTGPIFNVFVLMTTRRALGPCPPVLPGSCGPRL